MNNFASTSYDQFAQSLATMGTDAAMQWLADEFRQNRQYAEWFEVLKMQARHQVGLELIRTGDENSEDAIRREQLEPLLYKACGQVGEQLFRDGQPAQAWKYFQLVGDRGRAARLLRGIPVTQSNVQELIDVALAAGVAPEYGIELTLQFLGTCNAITSFDQHMPYLPASIRDPSAELLVRHVYNELTANVSAVVERREGKPPMAGNLSELIEQRPWLFAEDAYHIDPSHLAATVRIARMTTARAALEQANSLCIYGQRLDSTLIGAGDPPFEELFVAHEKYFDAAMGTGFEQTLAYFTARLPASYKVGESPSLAAEVLVDLLCRNNRWSEALRISLDWLDGAAGQNNPAPAALEIAQHCGELETLAQWFRQRDNLLMYTVALLHINSRR